MDTIDSPSPAVKKSISAAQFAQLESEILLHWSTAQYLPKDFKTLSIFDYATNLVKKNPVHATTNRRDEFRTFFAQKVEVLLGKKVAESVYTQLETNHSIATAQHYVPLSPNTLNATLMMSLGYADRTETERKNLIVLACSGVSFNNPWYPRGHLFQSLVTDAIVENQLNYFGRSLDTQPVTTSVGYNDQTRKHLEKTLLHYRSQKLIKKRELNEIIKIFDEIYFTKEVLDQKYYIDQLTLANFYGWQRLFTSSGVSMPNLIFFSQERVAAEALEKFHMKQQTILHEILFNQEWHRLIYKYFDTIHCGFNLKKKQGTFLFWATPKTTKDRVQLFAKDGVLVSPDETIKIPMTPTRISEALRNEEITPSTMLTFLVLSMYYGFFLVGGLDQPTYLTQTKAAYISLLQELGLHDEIEKCLPIVTSDGILTRPSIVFVDSQTGERSRASLLDLLVNAKSDSWPKLLEATKHITYQEGLYRLYPEIYRDFCEHEKDPELLAITEQDIEKFTCIDTKIPPWTVLTPF